MLGCDTVALFPSMKYEESAEVIRQEVVNSNIEFKGVDWKQAARYLRMTTAEE